jgi:predicted adenylyl cyclase CyaB
MQVLPSSPSGTNRRNLELKVRVSSAGLASVRAIAVDISVRPAECQVQEDHYFGVPNGRLKLRTITDDTGASRAELIAYRRPNTDGSRWSAYRIVPLTVDGANDLAAALAHVLPLRSRVRKRREVLIHAATRIHLDLVEGLGCFVELETVVSAQNDEVAAGEHCRIIEALGLHEWPVEAGSYSDLLSPADATTDDGSSTAWEDTGR